VNDVSSVNVMDLAPDSDCRIPTQYKLLMLYEIPMPRHSPARSDRELAHVES